MFQTSLIYAIQYQITACSKCNYNKTAHKTLWTALLKKQSKMTRVFKKMQIYCENIHY